MPYVASIGTYLPCWGAPQHPVAGDDNDAITLPAEVHDFFTGVGARIALAHNIGGPTAVSAVTILEGPGTHVA